MDRQVRWAPLEGLGLEHFHIRLDDGGVMADSVVIGERDGKRFGLSYSIRCDPSWRVREVRLMLAGKTSGLHLTSDGMGNWFDGFGRPVPEFSGCIDVDISATPFTNTLPIRRLGLAEGESRDLRVLYIPVPSLAARAVEQRYTCLREGAGYRYDGIFRNFTAELEVDEDGLVLDYPETFRRLP